MNYGRYVMKTVIEMSDGRQLSLTQITSETVISEVRKGYNRPVIWQAEMALPVKKLRDSFVRVHRGFGQSPQEAIAGLYHELDDAGELDDDRLPCESCGKGRRIISVADTYVPHDEKCPAMHDREEE